MVVLSIGSELVPLAGLDGRLCSYVFVEFRTTAEARIRACTIIWAELSLD